MPCRVTISQKKGEENTRVRAPAHTHTHTHSNFAMQKLTSARTKVQDSGKQTPGNLSPGSVWIEMALTFVGFFPKPYNHSLIGRETSKLSAWRYILQNTWPVLLRTAPQTNTKILVRHGSVHLYSQHSGSRGRWSLRLSLVWAHSEF